MLRNSVRYQKPRNDSMNTDEILLPSLGIQPQHLLPIEFTRFVPQILAQFFHAIDRVLLGNEGQSSFST
jgi:hypothetical protein